MKSTGARALDASLCLRNRQTVRALDLRLFRRIILALLKELLAVRQFELGIHLVGATQMAKFNETFLRHAGSTDVITFNYASRRSVSVIQGDIFICTNEAVEQARRFQTTWQSELVRYVVHGILHLQGYDDLKTQARQRMKREEDRLVRELGKRFHFQRMARKA